MDQRMKWIARGMATALFAVSVQAQSGQPAPATVKPKSTAAAGKADAGTQSGQANGARNSGHATESVEYKDPEDMTTRYRPGNNKTTKAPGASSGSSAAAHTDAKQPGIPACDGASKDAAKCAPAPATSGGQSTQHVNKVEGFTVKQ